MDKSKNILSHEKDGQELIEKFQRPFFLMQRLFTIYKKQVLSLKKQEWLTG